MKKVILSFCLTFSAVVCCATETRKRCTTEDAQKAEAEASSLQNWKNLYNSYHKFSQCDDASIAEGYSNTVARLLSAEWNEAAELMRLIKRNPNFEKFVLKHVDELMTPTQATQIELNAAKNCPSGGRILCKSIIARLHETDLEK